ncbi:MarR family winged helix-turn-helix transcriptional regulator [Pseudaestuariivita rosea]|uniref:MarR family winged helix-turn-helix transcriptional regulator n=1 Tax=Pseudaestuariivita rosea TaxID=2763263 RepID=UPI001ABB519F|nr:MarR family transcriptional regulator [Pseudaestuariivita rosea]
MHPDDFDLTDFLPYLLNQAAEECSLAFQKHYKDRYGMLRTEWRVLFHLGRFGTLTAQEISARSKMHKTKISRAITKLEHRRWLKRDTDAKDRRRELLQLTPLGQKVYHDLVQVAHDHQLELLGQFKMTDAKALQDMLKRLARLQ